MDCKKAKDMIPLYMDDMLEEKEMQEVVVHLLLCSECKRIHNDLSLISKKLQEAEPVIIPEGFKWKVLEADRRTDENERLVLDENNIDVNERLVLDKNDEKERKGSKDIKHKKNSKMLNWRTFSAIAAVLVISIVLSSDMIEMGTIPPEESGDMMTMARLETPDDEILWKEVENIDDEESYYIKQLQKQLGMEIQIEDSNKDSEDIWHFTIKVNETIYKYEGKGGEIWIEE